MLLRNARCAHISQTPLTKATGRVACILEDVRYGNVFCIEGSAACVGPDGGVAEMLAGHECAPCGPADIGTRK